MAKEIELTQGYKTLVDDIDFEYLSQFKWSYRKGYAKRTEKDRSYTLMHRVILGRKIGYKLASNELTDHVDRNRLNNTRGNLRVATRLQNVLNSSKRANASSRFRGVSWHKRDRKWSAQIFIHKRCVHLGSFDSEVLAARTYDQAALVQFGEFAVLNFPALLPPRSKP